MVHLEHGLPLELLDTLWRAGALVFLTPPSDASSRLRPIERKLRRKLPARAYHLSTAFLP